MIDFKRISIVIAICFILNCISLAQSKGCRQQKSIVKRHYYPVSTDQDLQSRNMKEIYGEIPNNMEEILQINSTEKNYEENNLDDNPNPSTESKDNDNDNDENEEIRPCTCGVFLSNQLLKKKLLPNETPKLTQELEKKFPCAKKGVRQCQNECFQTMIKYLPKSAEILCATIGEDIHKLKAHLFVQNCDTKWHNSNLAAGREYCCKDGASYNCPLF